MATGKQKEDFPGAYIPFDNSVGPVPTVSIDAAPTVQLCVNEDWLPYIVTCLKALSRPETWDDTYDNSVIAASEFAHLIGSMQDGCGTVTPSILCLSGTFADLDYGWVPTPGSPSVASYVSGTGWLMVDDATPQGFLDIKREFGVTTLIRGFDLVITLTLPYLVDYDITLFHNSTFTSIASDTAVAGPTITIHATGLSELADAIFIHIFETFGGGGANALLTDWGMCYTGAFPLSISPDFFDHNFDFTINDGGFTTETHPTYPNTGTYVSGTGWETDTNFVAGQIQEVLITHRVFSARTISSIEMDWSASQVANGGYRAIDVKLGGTLVIALALNNGVGSFNESFTPNITADELELVPTSANIGSSAGHAIVTRLEVRGIGLDPF
jgi:hypothetical protein